MAYIRPRTEELTGYQSGSDYRKTVDFANDFVMVYGIGKNMPERVAKYREAGGFQSVQRSSSISAHARSWVLLHT